MEFVIFALFIIGLLTTIFLKTSILYALIFGYILFFIYGLTKNFTFVNLIDMSLKGIKKVKDILIVFLLIGMITAVWRGAGTIPMIIYISSKLIIPSAFILITFLLNALVSTLIGTALGTSATIGVICMMIGNVMGANPVLVGGAILSGIYVGDRCSPMSTGAILISILTKTNVFDNIKQMIKTGIIPFLMASIIYLFAGIISTGNFSSIHILDLFNENFVLSWITILPAVLVIILSIFRFNIKYVMAISIIVSSIICITLQNMNILDLFNILFNGFKSTNTELAPMINGGGIVSMIRVFFIVYISSTYSIIFEQTGLLNKPKEYITSLSNKTNSFFTVLITSLFTAMIACNQTLSIMLTHQLCEDLFANNEELAITLENTAVMTSTLIPWSIAAAVPLATVGAPTAAILAAVYIYLVPIVNLIQSKKEVTTKVESFS